jgi:hypothetical protein
VKIDHAIEKVGEAEAVLAEALERLAVRHAAEADVAQLAHTLASKALSRITQLEDPARSYDAHLPHHDDTRLSELEQAMKSQSSELLPHTETPALLLLDDLEAVYVQSQTAEIAWIVLQQGAKACRDASLVDVVLHAHEECETTAKWLRTRIKVTAPQVLASG